MTKIEVNGFRRITKAAARKIYNGGGTVYFCPVNLRPGSPWNPEIAASAQQGCTFEQAENSVLYCNRTPETGKYLAFYVRG